MTVDLLTSSASGRESGCDLTAAEGSPAAGRYFTASERPVVEVSVARTQCRTDAANADDWRTPPVLRAARRMGGVDRPQVCRAKHKLGAGLYLFTALLLGTPPRTAWCEEATSTAPAGAAASGAPMAETALVAPVTPIALPQERSWGPVIVLGTASAVWLGVGVAMTVARNNAVDEVRLRGQAILAVAGQCVTPSPAVVRSCEELHSVGSRGEMWGNAARIAYIASGALAVGAVTYLLWPRNKATATGRIRALPTLQTGSVGVDVTGVW
ncbi:MULTISPECIES: hypothetical protein [Sorangium]|uniref:hypothetical protein n=1 Tax=Sorangium TaxID=39643 RepID=UPI003D9C3379